MFRRIAPLFFANSKQHFFRRNVRSVKNYEPFQRNSLPQTLVCLADSLSPFQTSAAQKRAFTSGNSSGIGDSTLAEAKIGIQEGMKQFGAGNYVNSERAFRSVLEKLEAKGSHAREHQIFQSATRLNLANVIRQQYQSKPDTVRFTEADNMYKQAIKTIRAVYGEHHIRLSKALREHALLLKTVGDVAGVEETIREAIAVHIMWSKVNANVDSVQEVDEERENRVIECVERVDLMTILGRALHAQGKMKELAELEEPIFKCIEYVELLDNGALPGVLQNLASYQQLIGADDSRTLDAIEMLKAEAKFNATHGEDAAHAVNGKPVM